MSLVTLVLKSSVSGPGADLSWIQAFAGMSGGIGRDAPQKKKAAGAEVGGLDLSERR
ncbi:MAG TPA: hypothetical protein VIJ94_01585 [Caulobacteraceae bacterium]